MNLDHLSDEQRHELRRAQQAARVVGLIIPLGLTLVGVVLYAIWLPRLPDPMAIHWGPINRLLPVIVLGTVVLIFVLEAGTTILQLDLADARTMPPANPTLFAAFGAAVLTGVLGFFAQPKLRIAPRVAAAPPEKLDLSDTERVVWFGAATATQMYWWIVGPAIALVIGGFVMTLSIRPFEWQPVVIMGATAVFVSVLTLMCSRFEVRIDEEGLQARALLGWPVFRVRAADVQRVEAANINPFGEFGGWGIRWDGGGQTGIVLRSREGIRITRTNGKRLVITLDDAEGAAAVLATVAERVSREHGRDPAEIDDTRDAGGDA